MSLVPCAREPAREVMKPGPPGVCHGEHSWPAQEANNIALLRATRAAAVSGTPLRPCTGRVDPGAAFSETDQFISRGVWRAARRLTRGSHIRHCCLIQVISLQGYQLHVYRPSFSGLHNAIACITDHFLSGAGISEQTLRHG